LRNIKDKPVLYVLGNHEFYGKAYPKLIESLKEAAKGTNVTILEKDTVRIGDVNFLGCTLWTDFELFGNPRIAGHQCTQIMTDFKKIRLSPKYSKLRSIDVSTIHRRSLQWLKSELEKHRGEKNVVITHHGPSILSLPYEYKEDISSAAYVSNLERVIEEFEPDYWVHGHLHNSSSYQVGSCRVVCNPRGYPRERNEEFTQNFVFQA
jgi:Icc-related predicted phosphoesterase